MKITLEQINQLGKGKIISYRGDEALKAVKRNGHALQYVDEKVFEQKPSSATIEIKLTLQQFEKIKNYL